MVTEEMETLNETLDSAVQAQENGARVSVDDDKGVKDDVYVGGDGGGADEPMVVEAEISVEKSFVCSNDGGGGVIGDAKETGSPAVEGLIDGGSTLLNGDGSCKETGLNENGGSVVEEVHGSLDSINEKGGNCGYVDNKGSVDENEGNPGEEFMKIPGSEGNEKFEANHNGEGEEDAGDEEHEYSVGDFVWGKIRSHPWWPGRIYDPSDASEYARKYSHGGTLLVAYFGDESFSWCSPSQLKPFAEDFLEMSGQSNSKSFVNAVQNAIDEISKLVELKMACYCGSASDRLGLDRHAVTNAGIKDGVLVPDCDVDKLLIPLNGPTELLSTLRYIAKVVSNTNLLEYTVLRNWLSAFYQVKGGHKLPIFYEPVSIEGLEDKSRNVEVTDVKDFNGVVQVPFGGPVEEVWISSSVHPGLLGQTNESVLQKCPAIAEDKLYERRKKKTVAELIEEDMVVKPDNAMGSLVTDATAPSKLVKASLKAKGKSSDDTLSQDGSDLTSSSGKKRGRGKMSETEGSVKSQESEVWRAKNGGGEGEEDTKKDGVSFLGNNDAHAKEETEKGLASGRKKGTRKKVETKESSEKRVPRVKHRSGAGEEETKKKDGSSKEETDKGLASGRKRGRKKTVEIQDSTEKKVPGQKNGGKGKGVKEDGVSSIGNEGANAKEETEKGLASVRKRGRSKEAETQGSEKSAEKEVQIAKNGGGEGVEGAKEEDNGLSVGKNDDSNSKEETEKGLASRERKKSRYLSPPFTSLKKGASTEEDSLEAESKKTPVVRCTDEIEVDTVAISSPNPLREDQKKFIDTVKINASTRELVAEVRSAAINPLRMKEKSIVDMLLGFISEFRSALNLQGSNYKIYHKRQAVRKRKLPSSGLDAEIPESKSQRKGNEKKERGSSGVKKLEKDDGELGKKRKKKETIDNKKDGEAATTPVTLIVSFPPGFSLPSKNDLKAVFSKFGALNETETEVLYNCSCAMVVFVKNSDAVEAFNACIDESPFRPAKVSYRLRYSSDIYQKASDAASKEEGENPVNDASRVLFTVKEKLELMTSMLEKSDGNMLPEVQSKFEAEMKGLLEVVNAVI
ncbi:hypothetical protein Vadar_008701 [Vaccinium darrowii]|uniref:Uncharacterized protein n=1 Tax=Vaccinium darrowii TaxID=229202 RepID=A0ACB7YCF8_9ERIC|nr:hypothetical protein Vadar_008701 [Vaccinium darrowii]